MASCFGLVALILLHGLEVTAQFHSPMGNLQATNDLVSCTVQLIREFHNNLDTLRIYQSISPAMSSISLMIRKRIWDNHFLYPVLLSTIDKQQMQSTIIEKTCLAILNTPHELEIVINKIYYEYYHERAIICLAYKTSNPIKHLIDIIGKIWTKGLPRNIIFIATNDDTFETWIIGVPAYAKNNCQQIDLIKVGQYYNGVLTKFVANFYPPVNDLGGCELLVMVQPPFLPYVVSKDDNHPSGIVGELMTMLGISMNFTPKYVWSSTAEGMIKHLDASNLNLFFDLTPRALMSITNHRFSFGMTQVTFIVPINGKRESTIEKLLLPFDSFVWLAIFCVLICLMILSMLSRDRNIGRISFKIFGSLIGIGVGSFPNIMWLRIFLWYWLLPSYVLVQSYLACLTKQFTILPKSPGINTLNELVNSNLKIMCSIGTKTNVCKIGGITFDKLCQRCMLTSDEDIWDEFYPNLFKNGMMNNTAVLSNTEYIKAYSAASYVRALDDNPTNVNQLVVVKPGGDYIFTMKRKFERILAGGLIQFWREIYSNRNKRYFIDDSDEFMKHEIIKCCFILHSIGLTISIICFIIEIVIHHFDTKKCITLKY